MAKSATSEVIKLPSARLSFAKLYKPETFAAGQDARFSATFLLDPTKAEHKAKIQEIQAAAKKLIDEAGFKVSDFDVCFGHADKHPKKSKYDGYAGMFFLAASNKVRPTVVNRRREPVAEGDPQAPYSGCYVYGSITLWLQNNQYGKKINANLRAVQFEKDGEAFGMKPVNAEDEFEPLEGDGFAAAGPDVGDGWDA
jgi:hypothetical protein